MSLKVRCGSRCVLVMVAWVEVIDMVVRVTIMLLVLHALLFGHVAFAPVVFVVISKNIVVVKDVFSMCAAIELIMMVNELFLLVVISFFVITVSVVIG